MNTTLPCPVCKNLHGGNCRMMTHKRDASSFDCDICGVYIASGTVLAGKLDPENPTLTNIQRAALSHRLQTATQNGVQLTVGSDWFEHIDELMLPSPAIQAANIIRYVGEINAQTGEKIDNLPSEFFAIVGSPNPQFAAHLIIELKQEGILTGIDASDNKGPAMISIGLSLKGWELYEAEKKGQIAGKRGFIAMKFEDSVLDPFIEDIVKPAVKEGIGYELVDMRNVTRAGVIDNIMRTEIRDAAFVIVDLTHDNPGAYWEAGYAEGLGKPVIYICEKTKFDKKATHFDTNHCTTIFWTKDNKDEFSKNLVATLRRSLNLSANGI